MKGNGIFKMKQIMLVMLSLGLLAGCSGPSNQSSTKQGKSPSVAERERPMPDSHAEQMKKNPNMKM